MVTGGASGLGLAVVDEFLQRQAKVSVLDLQTGESIEKDRNVHFIMTDITNESSVTQ